MSRLFLSPLFEIARVRVCLDHVASFSETAHNRRVKYWEIIADRLSAAGWSWAVSQLWIAKDEQSGLLTRTETTEGALLCGRMIS
jgi:hypothetical protein